MQKLIYCTFSILVLFTSLSFSQTQRLDYKKIDYIRVSQNQTQQFMKAAAEVMKPAYQKMVDSGDIRSWELYIVNYPGGQRSNYNFVCVVTVPEIETLQDKFSKIRSLYFMPANSRQDESENLASLASLIASEIWRIQTMIPRDTAETNSGKYMMMDYMRVDEGDGPVYLTLEDEVAKPLHEERISQNTMAAWEVYSLVTPGGTNYEYNYATGNFFENIGDMQFGFSRELIRNNLPGRDIAELLNTIYKTRDLVKSELWELAVHAN